MTIRELAHHYMRFWPLTGVADNAPAELRLFVRTNNHPRASIREALQALATGRSPDTAPTAQAVAWFAANPAAIARFDEVLRSKKPPTSFAELADRAYQAAMQDVMADTREFLKSIANSNT